MPVCCKISPHDEVLSSRNSRNYCIAAHWKSPELTDSASTTLRFGYIQFSLYHAIIPSTGRKEHILAVVNWLKSHLGEMHFGSTCFVLRKHHEGTVHVYIN